jgi:hypothetical protein
MRRFAWRRLATPWTAVQPRAGPSWSAGPHLIRISGEVRLSAETIEKAGDAAQAATTADMVEDKPYDKLTTSRLAKALGIRTGELTDKLITAGMLVKEGASSN